MFDMVRWLLLLQPVHYIAMVFRDLTLVGDSADIFEHIVIFWMAGLFFMTVLYGLLKYLTARRIGGQRN